MYLDKNDYENYCSFFVAKSHAQAKYLFAQEHSLDFKEELGENSVKIYRCFDKYIRDGEIIVEMFEDEYWIKALYLEGGYLEFPNENDDYGERVQQNLESSIRYAGKFDENCCIVLPKKSKKESL